MAQMTDEEKKRALEMFKQQAMGPAGIQGPRGAIFPTNGATISEPTRRSFTDNVRNTIRQNTPSGAYGFDQTVGPLLGAINPLPSWKRTFTGENVRKYINPGSGLDWKQRLALGAEDALNLWAAGGLAKSATNRLLPTYDYGIHVSANPNIKQVASGAMANTGGVAGDAMENASYFWRMSPHSVDAPKVWSNKELQDSAASWSQYWADKMPNLTMYDDGIQPTAYLIRTRRNKNIVYDDNFFMDEKGTGAWNSQTEPMPSLVATNNQPLKVIDKTYGLSARPDLEPGSFEAFNYVTNVGNGYPAVAGQVRPMNQAMQNDVQALINQYAKKIARNNARIARRMK